MKISRTVLAAAALVGAASAPAYAATITIKPVAVNASSSFSGYEAPFAIDANALTDWASASQGTASKLAIDLGGVFKLVSGTFTDRVTSGGGNGAFAGGVTDFTTSFTFQACADFSCSTLLGAPLSFSKTAPVAPTSPANFAYLADLAGLTGQYFLYSVTGTNGNNNPGLSNISFVAAVPEPATWALMILGFGIVGSALRRRRTQVRFNFA